MTNQPPVYTMRGVFPCPVYIAKRDSNLSPKEDKDIEDVIKEGMYKEGMYKRTGNSSSVNSYIFNSKLKELKQFCEHQIAIYVKEVINPEEEVDFYITQSWINVTKPGESHENHSHSNTIISGAFYIQTDVGQTIDCFDPNWKIKQHILISQKNRKNGWKNECGCTLNGTVMRNCRAIDASC